MRNTSRSSPHTCAILVAAYSSERVQFHYRRLTMRGVTGVFDVSVGFVPYVVDAIRSQVRTPNRGVVIES